MDMQKYMSVSQHVLVPSPADGPVGDFPDDPFDLLLGYVLQIRPLPCPCSLILDVDISRAHLST